jgi:ABC-type bacteriocin/lantibiotic exporter with double-glycine peptidase domain
MIERKDLMCGAISAVDLHTPKLISFQFFFFIFSTSPHISLLFVFLTRLTWIFGCWVGVGRTFTIDRLVPRSEIASSHFLQLGVVALFFFLFLLNILPSFSWALSFHFF